MRKLVFGICVSKSAFVFTTKTVQSLSWLNQKFMLLAFCFVCAGVLVSDLLGIPEDRFSLGMS